MLLAHSILTGVEESEDQVVVQLSSDEASLTFTALAREAPRVGEEFELEVTKRPGLGEKIAELD